MNGPVMMLGQLLELLRMARRFLYRFRRFWRSLYYAVTNALIIIGCAALLAGIWYISFLL